LLSTRLGAYRWRGEEGKGIMILEILEYLRGLFGVRSIGDMLLYGSIAVVLALVSLFSLLVWVKPRNRDSN
jgi:hypothetical protein